jgi:hypothetical protein
MGYVQTFGNRPYTTVTLSEFGVRIARMSLYIRRYRDRPGRRALGQRARAYEVWDARHGRRRLSLAELDRLLGAGRFPADFWAAIDAADTAAADGTDGHWIEITRVEPPADPADIRWRIPLLEGTLADSGLDDEAAAELVSFTLGAGWQDYWAGLALNWVDAGLWRKDFAELLSRVAESRSTYSQRTRHHAQRLVRSHR